MATFRKGSDRREMEDHSGGAFYGEVDDVAAASKRQLRGAALAGSVAGVVIGGPIAAAAVAAGAVYAAAHQDGEIGEAARSIGDLAANISEKILMSETTKRVIRKNRKVLGRHLSNTSAKLGRAAIRAGVEIDRGARRTGNQLAKTSQRTATQVAKTSSRTAIQLAATSQTAAIQMNDTAQRAAKLTSNEARRQAKLRAKQLKPIVKKVNLILKDIVKKYSVSKDELQMLTHHVTYQVISVVTSSALQSKLKCQSLTAQEMKKFLLQVRSQVENGVCKSLNMNLSRPCSSEYDQVYLEDNGDYKSYYDGDMMNSYRDHNSGDEELKRSHYPGEEEGSDNGSQCSDEGSRSCYSDDDDDSRSCYSDEDYDDDDSRSYGEDDSASRSQYSDDNDDDSRSSQYSDDGSRSSQCSDDDASQSSYSSGSGSRSSHESNGSHASTYKDDNSGSRTTAEESFSEDEEDRRQARRDANQRKSTDFPGGVKAIEPPQSPTSSENFHDCVEEFGEFMEAKAPEAKEVVVVEEKVAAATNDIAASHTNASTTEVSSSSPNRTKKQGLENKKKRAMLGKIIGKLQNAIADLENDELNLPEAEDEAEREMIDHIVERLMLPPRRVTFAKEVY